MAALRRQLLSGSPARRTRAQPRRPLRAPSRATRKKIAKRLSSASASGQQFPTMKLEVAYSGAGPQSDLSTVTWTDESAYWRSGSVARGRSSVFDEITTSTASILCTNADRHFDPAFNANIVPLMPCRLSATMNGSRYPLFTGYITGSPQHYLSATYAECSMRLVDAFEILKSAKQLGSPWYTQCVTTSPSYWWRLSDSSTLATDVGFATTHKPGLYAGSYTQGQDSIVATDDDGCTLFADGSITVPNLTYTAGSLLTFGGWFTANAHDSSKHAVLLSVGGWGNAPDAYLLVYVNRSTGKLAVDWGDNLTSGTITGTSAVDDTTAHHVAVVFDYLTTGLMTLYVDGVAQASTAIGTFFDTTTKGGFRWGWFTDATTTSVTAFKPWVGALDELQAWPVTALSAAQVATLYAAGANGWSGDTTGQRIGRYLAAAGWPSAMRDIDAGYTTMGAASTVADAMSGIQAAVKAEAGVLDVDPMGRVRFRDRYRRITDGSSTAPIATFGDSTAAELPYFYDGFEPQYDRDRIITQATGNRPGGPTMVATNTGNRAGYRTDPIGELALRTDAEVQARLDYRVDKYKDPQYRIDSMVIKPQSPPPAGAAWTTDMLWSIVLGLDMSQQFAVIRRPQNVGAAKQWNVLVEQVSHTISPQSWQTSAALSPADTRVYASFDYGVFDTDVFAF